MTTPTEAAVEIFDIIGAIKKLTERKEELQDLISVAIDLGTLEDSLMADDKGYALGNIRCCPVVRTTYEYPAAVKSAIKQLQEQAQVEGLTKVKTSTSYRFTAIEKA